MSGRKAFHLFCSLTFLFSCAQAQANFKTTQHYQAQSYVSRNDVLAPRGLALDEYGDILVVARGSSQVTAIFEEGNSVRTAVIVEAPDFRLNHGLAYSNRYLYASSNDTVFRWNYAPGQRSKITGTGQVVVQGIPEGGNHLTRTLIIDGSGYLYVSIGSDSNAGLNPERALIRRFNVGGSIPTGGFQFDDGVEFVTGVRNAVGLAFDNNNALWGVDCGADELRREDLGPDIHNTNPADELIKFEQGAFYGFPYCWTVGQLDGYSSGDQFAWPDFMTDGIHTDEWCRVPSHNPLPTLPLPAHNAPLGILFYDGTGCDRDSGSFPCSMKGDAFVAFHGSWNKDPPSGYKVSRIPINSQTGEPTGEIQDILFDPTPASCVMSPTTCLRPVDLVFNLNGHLIVTSDSSNEIFKISHKSSSSDDIIKKSLSLPGILAIVFITLITVGLFGMVVYKFCCPCRRNNNVSYERDQI